MARIWLEHRRAAIPAFRTAEEQAAAVLQDLHRTCPACGGALRKRDLVMRNERTFPTGTLVYCSNVACSSCWGWDARRDDVRRVGRYVTSRPASIPRFGIRHVSREVVRPG